MRVNHISERFNQVQDAISQACHRARRREEEITLIAVTKTWPAEVVQAATEVGLTDFGENKVQELIAKAPLFPENKWHMIGHLQRNKARQVMTHAQDFHALDNLRLAGTLNRLAAEAGRIFPCFIQVNVSREDSKFGIIPDGVGEFVIALEEFESIKIKGLMTLASPDIRKVREEFQLLRSIRNKHERLIGTGLSMGMSGDYEIAIEEGATHIRLGSALFGVRQ
ncbi:MAG: YggS family pyridoxal phosphate-dependent enzyme [Bacteroidetes bacterium]|nr:YggS family pyridoxal phosphate-dependent enzyme [Bacteroidota bacterium]